MRCHVFKIKQFVWLIFPQVLNGVSYRRGGGGGSWEEMSEDIVDAKINICKCMPLTIDWSDCADK